VSVADLDDLCKTLSHAPTLFEEKDPKIAEIAVFKIQPEDWVNFSTTTKMEKIKK
jgi:hypothetical protein